MKKIYLKPEMTRFELFGEEAILQAASVTIDVNDNVADAEVDEIDDLLSNPNDDVWED